MSEYYKKLDAVAQKRYLEKLQLLDLGIEDDPYSLALDANFIDDMTKWPKVEYGHIFCYFIERPGVYTKKQLLNWKSLQAYNYFFSGHVRTVRIWPLEHCCILKASVNPSQNSPEKAHTAWVGLRYSGEIITVHCNCMAGLGEGCSHSAAILFKVDAAVRNGLTSVTSSLSYWNQCFSNKHEPAEIIDIKFGKKCLLTSDVSANTVLRPTESEISQFLNGLQQISPDAAVLSSCHRGYISDSASSISFSNASIPPTILSLYHARYKNLSQEDLLKECDRVLKEELLITNDESAFLFNSTQLQAQSLLWHEHRRGRLTASKFGAICKTSVAKPSRSVLNEILCGGTVPNTEAVRWGRRQERKALAAYMEVSYAKHDSLEVSKCGLLISSVAPHLGASADGMVSCTCCGPGVLEIKCPYSIKDKSPVCASYIVKVDGRLQLSREHNYYYQVQGQMCTFDCLYCDFVCWTPIDTYIERIYYDAEFVSVMVPKLDAFFGNVILPKVLCGECNVDNGKDDCFCLCRKGESGKMIECDNIHCNIGWYHYQCLNIPDTFEPTDDKEWFCPDCERKQTHV